MCMMMTSNYMAITLEWGFQSAKADASEPNKICVTMCFNQQIWELQHTCAMEINTREELQFQCHHHPQGSHHQAAANLNAKLHGVIEGPRPPAPSRERAQRRSSTTPPRSSTTHQATTPATTASGGLLSTAVGDESIHRAVRETTLGRADSQTVW